MTHYLGGDWVVECSEEAAAYLRRFAAWLDGPNGAVMPTLDGLSEPARTEADHAIGARLRALEARSRMEGP